MKLRHRISLETFLVNYASEAMQKKKVVYFVIDKKQQSPTLFFSQVLQQNKQDKLGQQARSLDVAELDKQTLHARLTTTFLGQSCRFWLKNSDRLDRKKKRELLGYIREYTGPHSIFIDIAEESSDIIASPNSDKLLVDCSSVNQKTFIALAHFFGTKFSRGTQGLMRDFFVKHPMVPLDTACMIMQYLSVLGAHASSDEAYALLERNLDVKASLFTLAGYFFARKKTAFFAAWATVVHEYPFSFWVSFWSDQVWRAYYYCCLRRENNIAAARKIGFRLPFGFLQRDWSSLSTDTLKKAHDFLYTADINSKNGCSDFSLDIFFICFFSDSF